MQLSHTDPVAGAVFDDPNLVLAAGLVPLVGLAGVGRLHALADEHLSVPGDKGANAGAKVTSLVAGMVAGADSIDDMALLRHGAMGKVFDHPYAPSTRGSFLRSFSFGHVRQLDAVATQPHRRNRTTVEHRRHPGRPNNHARPPNHHADRKRSLPPQFIGGSRLRDVVTLVPRVLLFVTLAEPTPSGSTGMSRLCQGCSHPPRHLPCRAALSCTALLRQDGDEGLPPPFECQRLTAQVDPG
jgi:hypothetical protein